MQLKDSVSLTSIFPGGGEMGELIRNKDWSATPLGPIESWPVSLRVIIGTMLNSRFPMFVFWGPDQHCFYNDAYRPSLGYDGKHPEILGAKGAAFWAEIWEIIKPLIDQVMAGNGATWSENQLIPIYRNGKLDDVYWTFSYSPIIDENGIIQGILVTCTETTNQVNTLKRLLESEMNYRNLVFESPIATSVFRGPDFRIELANSEALKLWGKDHSVIGKTVIKAIPELEGQPYMKILEDVYNTGVTYEGEENLAYLEKDGEIVPVYITFIYKALRDLTGKIDGILCMGYDVTEQVRVREEIALAEQTSRLSIEVASLGTYDFNYSTGKLIASKRLLEMMGFSEDGVSMEEITSRFHPDDAEVRARSVEAAKPSGDLQYQFRVIHPDQSIRWIQTNAKIFYDSNGESKRIIGTTRDITEEKDFVSKLEFSEKKFRDTVKQAPVGILVLYGPDFFIETANQGYCDIVGRQESDLIGKYLYDAMPEVQSVVHPLLTRVFQTGEDFFGSEFEVIIHKNGVPQTCFYNFIYQALRNDKEEITGIVVVANEVTKMVKAKLSMRESEREFRNLVTNSPIAMTIWRGQDCVIEIANETLLKNIWRKDASEVIGKKLLDVFPELKDQKFPELIARVWQTKTTHRENEATAFIDSGDGRKVFYLDFEYAPLVEANDEMYGIMVTVNDVTEKVESRQRVEDAESRLRLAAEGTGLATWDLNLLTGNIIYSPRLNVIFGHDENYVLSHDDMREQLLTEDRKNVVEPAFEKALQTGVYFYESRLSHPDGTLHWVRTQGKVIFDEQERPVRMLGTMMDITQQRRSEAYAARLAAIVEASDDAIISKDLNGLITSWNQGAIRIFGYSVEEAIGNPIIMLIPDERRNEEIEILSKIRTGERVEHFETQRVNKNGDLLDISLTISPIRNSEGTVIGISKIARDITSQKIVERQVAENDQRLQIVVEASELGTWEINIKTGEVGFSAKYLEMLGYDGVIETPTHEELKNRIHPEDRPGRDVAFQAALKSGKLYQLIRIIWPDGTLHWVEGRGKTFYDENGEPEKMIGTIRDLTEERLYQQNLERNEQKFRLLADSMPQLIWTGDAFGNINYYNQALYDFTGMSPVEVMNDGWVSMIHPEDRDENMRRWQYSVQTGEDYLFENRFKRSDGEYRWHLSRAVAQRNVAGNIEMWVGTSTEIHDQKIFARELEKQVDERTKDLQQANYHLEQMNQELASFAYVSSHDLQEPLRKIQTFATRITDKESLSEEGAEYFRRMQNAAKRMQSLIDDLLTYSRTNTAERTFEKIQLKELVQDIVVDLESVAHAKNARIEIGELPELLCIPFQFRQLFTNLISNSLKFNRPDSDCKVEISYQIVNGADIDHVAVNSNKTYYRVDVADNGIGFDPVYKTRIFELFQRLHGRNDFQGTGIGLAICKKIVENHFGFITATGQPNNGATFHIFVPVNQ